MLIQPFPGAAPQNLPAAADVPLIKAVIDGDLPEIERLLQTEDVNARDENGWTALMHAAFDGDLPVVMLFVAARDRVDLNAVNDHGETALILAAEERCIAVARLLLDSGARANVVDKAGFNAVFTYFNALQGEDADIDLVRSFLHSDLDLGAKDARGENILMLVARMPGREVKSLWLAAVANHPRLLNACNDAGYTALMISSEEGDAAFARQLVEAGAEIAWTANDGKRALDLAVEVGDFGLAAFLRDSEIQRRMESLAAAKLLRQQALSQWAQLNPGTSSTRTGGVDAMVHPSGKSIKVDETLNIAKEFTRGAFETDYSELGLKNR